MDFLRFAGRATLAVWLLDGAGCSLALKTDGEQCTVDADCTARGSSFANTTCKANVCQPKPQCSIDADCKALGGSFANDVCVANVCKPQCSADADCKALGGSFASDVCVANVCKPDPKWGCIGNVQPLPKGGTTTVSVQLLDLISMTPVTNDSTVTLTVQLCAKLDPTCGKPLSPTPTLDSMANVSATVASDFDGFLNVVDGSGQYLPSLIFLDLVAVTKNAQILLVSKNEETTLLAAAGITPVMNSGLLLVPTVDCTGARTAGVSVSLSPMGGETRFYAINNVPMTGATQTDSAGNAGFVNVTNMDVTVTATVAASGKEMGKVGTIVQPGALTYQLLRPTSTL